MTGAQDGDGADGFFSRWSRLKRVARTRENATPSPAVGADGPSDTAGSARSPDPQPDILPQEELARLPPLETLGPTSDYTAFLRPGVPAALRQAALRKAWATDPVISTFIEVADYDWDFNAPGYGALLPTDSAAKLLKTLFKNTAMGETDPSNTEKVQGCAEILQENAGNSLDAGPEDPAAPAKPDACESDGAAPATGGAAEPQPAIALIAPAPAPLPAAAVTPCQAVDASPLETREMLENPGPRRRRHGGAVPR